MKIEVKGSLWKAVISSGCYSDYYSETIIVSANTYEEAKNAIKIYYQNQDNAYKEGLVFNDGEKWQYRGEPYKEGGHMINSPFDTRYGKGEDVKLSRLKVIYDGGEIAKSNLFIN